MIGQTVTHLGPEERRRRRALLKQHHPDRGGDPAAFIRAVAAFSTGRSGAATRSGPADDLRFAARPRGFARITSWYTRRRDRRRRPPRVL